MSTTRSPILRAEHKLQLFEKKKCSRKYMDLQRIKWEISETRYITRQTHYLFTQLTKYCWYCTMGWAQ